MSSDEKLHKTAGVIAPPPLLILGSVGLGFVLEALVQTTLGAGGATRIVLGGVLGGLGLALALPAMLRFKSAGTHVEPWKPTTALVIEGPYRWTRNPMYVGLLLLQLAVALIFDSLWVIGMLVPSWAALRYGVIAREERYLEELFGENYRAYKASVRRWF